jgi:hypothetical protein
MTDTPQENKADEIGKRVMTKSKLANILKNNSDEIDVLIYKLMNSVITARVFREELAKAIMKVINKSSEMAVVDDIMEFVRGSK